MVDWIIIRTDALKEAYVVRQIERLGFPAWCPVEVRVVKPSAARRVTSKKALRRTTEHPVLPKRLFCAVPVAVHGDLRGLRHIVAIECDAASEPLRIPAIQIRRFRDEIDRLNADALALSAITTRKTKAVWKNMREALETIVSEAKESLEEAA